MCLGACVPRYLFGSRESGQKGDGNCPCNAVPILRLPNCALVGGLLQAWLAGKRMAGPASPVWRRAQDFGEEVFLACAEFSAQWAAGELSECLIEGCPAGTPAPAPMQGLVVVGGVESGRLWSWRVLACSAFRQQPGGLFCRPSRGVYDWQRVPRTPEEL